MKRGVKAYALGLGAGLGLAGGASVAPVAAHVDSHGSLNRDPVQEDGRTICAASSVWLDCRRQGSFIVCT
jgi:uncharacterized spore protein YtfJ